MPKLKRKPRTWTRWMVAEKGRPLARGNHGLVCISRPVAKACAFDSEEIIRVRITEIPTPKRRSAR